MSTLLGDASIFNNDDAICITKGGDPVADKERGSLIHDGFEFLHDRGFGLGVDGREHIVENQNFRTPSNRTGYGDALALSA